MKNKRDGQKWIIVKTIVVVTSILNSSVFVTSKAGLLQMPSKYNSSIQESLSVF